MVLKILITKKTDLQKQPPQVFCKKRCSKLNFANFTGKHLCWSLKAYNEKETIKKRLQLRCFPVNIANFLRIPILKNICCLLLLNLQVMYVRDFRANILACKDYTANTKT